MTSRRRSSGSGCWSRAVRANSSSCTGTTSSSSTNRSTGSSFGKCDQLDHQTQGMDLCDLFEWIVNQSWSTEDIGMIGNSWLGLAQNAAISCNPKYLRAVLPITGGEDTFVPMYPGGLYNVGLDAAVVPGAGMSMRGAMRPMSSTKTSTDRCAPPRSGSACRRATRRIFPGS